MRACSTLNGCLQVQCDGEFLSDQPYLRERPSLKTGLVQSESMLIDGQYCQPGRSSFFLGEFHGTLERSRELSLQVFHIFLLLCTFVRVDSSLDVLLSIMAIVELLVLLQ